MYVQEVGLQIDWVDVGQEVWLCSKLTEEVCCRDKSGLVNSECYLAE